MLGTTSTNTQIMRLGSIWVVHIQFIFFLDIVEERKKSSLNMGFLLFFTKIIQVAVNLKRFARKICSLYEDKHAISMVRCLIQPSILDLQWGSPKTRTLFYGDQILLKTSKDPVHLHAWIYVGRIFSWRLSTEPTSFQWLYGVLGTLRRLVL